MQAYADHKGLLDYFDRHLKLSKEESHFLVDNVPVVQYKAQSVLLKEGQISTAFYFILTGIVRMYYVVDGIEKTTFFYTHQDFVSSYESFTQQIPAAHNIECLTDVAIAVFNIDVVQRILQKYPRFESLSRMVMEKELSVYQEMISSFVTLNGEQRYEKLCRENSALLQQIPQYHIATYLGVSPETLSRIKKRIALKN